MIQRLRTEWHLLTSWPVEDWLWAFLAVAWVLCAGMATATAQAPTPVADGGLGGIAWPGIEWRITAGNVGTILAVAWWVGRWGARQVALLDQLPVTLDRLTQRLESLEQRGCAQLRDHRRVLNAIEKAVPDDE